MPVKFKESEAKIGANRRKVGMKHCYMHTISTDELKETLENKNTRGPRRQKIQNELVKRKAL
jgi:hypothetical protein